MNDNKLIAEFMGYEVKHGKCYSPKYNDGTIAPMQFQKSWDWLMSVVDKIESLGYEFSIAESRCEIKRNSDNKQVLNVDDWYIKKEATYNAVVEFIKEYNK